MLNPTNFFDLSKCSYRELFDRKEVVWEALKLLPDFINSQSKPRIYGEINKLAWIGENVHIGKGTIVEPNVTIIGPAIIGSDCEIRAGAYVRKNVIIGDEVIVGHSTEIKASILLNNVTVPHLAYVGDSILGWKAHLGAGVIISNVKLDNTPIKVRIGDQLFDTGLLKLGAIVGDLVEVGCNSVLNPGTFVGKRTMAYPNSSLRGYYPPDSIIKLRQSHEVTSREVINEAPEK